jgi:hypothetical protein
MVAWLRTCEVVDEEEEGGARRRVEKRLKDEEVKVKVKVGHV